jgi:hypothetical protein
MFNTERPTSCCDLTQLGLCFGDHSEMARGDAALAKRAATLGATTAPSVLQTRQQVRTSKAMKCKGGAGKRKPDKSANRETGNRRARHRSVPAPGRKALASQAGRADYLASPRGGNLATIR